jgi:hypothetical protein
MLSATAVLLSLLLLQFPPTVIVPPSVELKVYCVVLSFVKEGTTVVSARVGGVVSMVKELTVRLSLATPLESGDVTLSVQLL